MKITGKLLLIFLIQSLLSVSVYAETIQFGRKKTTKKADNINTAKIKDDELGVASTTFSNLPKNEVINTFYADPLSDDFMGKDNSFHDSERNRSTKDLLSEFEGQVKVINDNTEIPDENELIDEHSKEDRARIEARADELLKEAAIQESKNNSGENILENNPDKITEKLSDKNELPKIIASYTDLYKENASESAEIIDNTSSDDNKSEITDLNDKQPEEDPEFLNNPSSEEVVIVEENVSGENLEIPNYEELEGIVSEDDSKDNSLSNSKISKKDKKTTKLSKKEKLLKKMSEPLEPVLLTEGKPKSADDESEKVHSYSGLLIPEKQPLGRNKHMLRWVLKLEDGSRIPLKSNLKLLQEVKKENNLNDYVTISGKMRTSALEKDLKYLVPDNIVKGLKITNAKDSSDKKESDVIQTEEAELKKDTEIKTENEIKPGNASDIPATNEVSKLLDDNNHSSNIK